MNQGAPVPGAPCRISAHWGGRCPPGRESHMHEELYAPLPDAQRYLDRLGMDRPELTPENMSRELEECEEVIFAIESL